MESKFQISWFKISRNLRIPSDGEVDHNELGRKFGTVLRVSKSSKVPP